MASKSGQAGVLNQEACVAARLSGTGDLEVQAEEGLSIRTIHHRGVGYEKECQCEWRGGSRNGSGIQSMCSLWSPRTLWFSSL